MTNHLSTFTFAPGLNLRTVMRDGAPWFVAADVAGALGLSNTTVALKFVDSDDRAKHCLGQGGSPTNLVNESGLYSLILKSRKPEARAFKKWVTSVVLPAIRKDGAYVVGEEKVVTGEMSLEEMTLKVMTAMTAKVARLTEEKAALEFKVAQAAPAVAFVKDYVEAAGSQTLTEVAKTLCLPPRMFISGLIGDGILYRRGLKTAPLPTQAHLLKGRFVVKQYENDYGQACPQTRVTPKGIAWLSDKYAKA